MLEKSKGEKLLKRKSFQMIEWSRRMKSENWLLDFVLRKPSEIFKKVFFLMYHKSLGDLVKMKILTH